METSTFHKELFWGVVGYDADGQPLKAASTKKETLLNVGLIPADDWAEFLRAQPRTVKLGVDPTSKDLHLGHAVVLRKLRWFQDQGHKVILVIGDFTAKIGDPSGANATRPVLTDREIKENMKTYVDQAKLILDSSKTDIRYNSAWLSKMSLSDLLGYAMKINLSTLLEREDFAKRLKQKEPVGFHELLYPLTQAIDSFKLEADIEIGGWDQRLNLLLGRELQAKLGSTPQRLVIVEPLIGLDGQKKMSKSLGNYIGLAESADEMFGKIMSLPDDLTDKYGYLAAMISSQELAAIKHPKDKKLKVAHRIVQLYHGQTEAAQAEKNFDQTFRQKQVADHLAATLKYNEKSLSLLQVVVDAADCSRSQAVRLIEQGAVELDGQKITDPHHQLTLDQPILLKAGRHTFRRLEHRR